MPRSTARLTPVFFAKITSSSIRSANLEFDRQFVYGIGLNLNFPADLDAGG